MTSSASRFSLYWFWAVFGFIFAYAPALIPTAAFAQDVKVLRIATGPIDTTEFPFGGLVGNAISNPPGSRECDRGGNCGVPGLIANTQSSEGTWNNLKALLRGDVDLALSQADIVNWSFYGIGDFEGKETFTRLRVLARLYPSTIHLIARPGTKITSVKDLVGKRVAVDGEGTGTRYSSRLWRALDIGQSARYEHHHRRHRAERRQDRCHVRRQWGADSSAARPEPHGSIYAHPDQWTHR